MSRLVSLAASLFFAVGVRCSNDGGAMPNDCEESDGGEVCAKTCTPLVDSECGDPADFVCDNDGECHPR